MFTTEKLYLLLFQVTPSIAFIIALIAIIKNVVPKLIEKTAEQVIETAFLKRQTEITESVKIGFNRSLEEFKRDLQENLQIKVAKEVESLKASLAKENIDFQVNQAEFIKRRFMHIEELSEKMYELEYYISSHYKIKITDYHQNVFENFNKLKDNLLIESYRSTFFLDEQVEKAIYKFIQTCVKAVDIHHSYANVRITLETAIKSNSSEETIAEQTEDLGIKRQEYLVAKKELTIELENINNQFKKFKDI